MNAGAMVLASWKGLHAAGKKQRLLLLRLDTAWFTAIL
jgi:hypothetical protein